MTGTLRLNARLALAPVGSPFCAQYEQDTEFDHEAMVAEMEAVGHHLPEQFYLHHYALAGDATNIMHALAQGYGVNDLDPEYRSPLIYAVIGGDKTCVETLIKAGADIQYSDGLKLGVIHWAAFHGNHKVPFDYMNSTLHEFHMLISSAPPFVCPRLVCRRYSLADARMPSSGSQRVAWHGTFLWLRLQMIKYLMKCGATW